MSPAAARRRAADPGAGARMPALALFEIRAVADPDAEIAALAARGFVAPGREDLPPHPFRPPFDWHADPFGDRNWMFQLHAWRLLDPHLNRLRRAPGHPRAFADIHAVVADWHRDNLRGRRGPFTWHDMATGLRALRLAFLELAARRHGVALPDPGIMAELVERHAAMLADPDRLSAGNHGLFQLSGLMALLWLHPDLPRAARARRHAVAAMTALLDRQLGPEGVHTENSPYYHFFATRKIARILKAPWWSIPRDAPPRARLARARAACDWLADPAGRCVPVGDSSERAIAAAPPRLADWPHLRQGDRLGAVLDGYGVVRSAPEVPAERSSLVFMTASFRAHDHKHGDCLSLVWQEAGRYILVDSGKYGNERDAMRAYFRSTRAHNTVEIGAEPFRRGAGHPYGAGMRRVEPLGRAWLIEAEADRRHLGAVHRRAVLYRPGRFLLAVDHVALAAATPQPTLTAWWHLDPALTPAEAGPGAWTADLPDGRVLHLAHAANAAPVAGRLHVGEAGPWPQGWVSRAYLAYQPAPALGFAAPAAPGYLAATLLEIAEPGAAPALALDWRPDATVGLAGADAGAPPRRFDLGAFALEADPALL